MGEVTFDLIADFYPLLDPAFSRDHYIPPTCSCLRETLQSPSKKFQSFR
jgi:hypothetical protein